MHEVTEMDPELPIPRTNVDVTDEAKKAVVDVLESGQFIKGVQVEKLGEEFAKFCQAKHGVCASSGSTALFAALKIAGVGLGDEVVTVPNTFIATVNAIILAGGRPVFADVDARTFNMDPDSLRSVISPRTKAILPVHLYGLMAPMPEIMELAESKNLVVIEDACQAHGAEIENKRAGSHADMAAFSFYPSKILNTAGDGGIVVTSNDDYAKKLERFVNHGRKSQYEYSEFGFNFRLSEIPAAVVRQHLKRIGDEIDARRRTARTYDDALEDIAEIDSPEEPKTYRHVYYLYTVLAEKRDLLLDFLKKKQIGASVEYPVVLHELDYVASLNPGLPPEGLQVSERCLRKICALPMFSTITEEQLNYVSEAIHTFYREST